jgi:hypothetical protein
MPTQHELKQQLIPILKDLAVAAQTIAMNQFQMKRNELGFQGFIADLRDARHNVLGHNWNLTNGMLTVRSNANFAEVDEYLTEKLSNVPWFTPCSPDNSSKIQSVMNYGYPFKMLGKYGANPAVDPALFLANTDEPVKVLAIIRADQTRALPGGMQEAAVKKTCINELLEECFSGNFFKENSISSHIIDAEGYWSQFNEDQQLSALLEKVILATKQLSNAQKNSLIEAISSNEPDETRSALIRRICQKIENLPDEQPIFGSCQRAQVLAHVRVGLYEVACPQQYAQMKNLLEERMHSESRVVNQTDPRNTDYAWMETTVVNMAVDSNLIEQLKNYGLELEGGAGDDATNSHFPTLEEFCCSQQNAPYSDHASLVLNALANVIENNLLVSTNLLEQCRSIAVDYASKLPGDRVEHMQEINQTLTSMSLAITSDRLKLFSSVEKPPEGVSLKCKFEMK